MNKLVKILGIGILALAAIVFGGARAWAMASYNMTPTKTAVATTTRAWLTPGTGTTTITLPSPLSLGLNSKYDKAILLIEADSTSTAVTGNKLNARVEYSLDGIDWFAATVASSSVNITGAMSQVVAFNLATSTEYTLAGSNPSASRIHQAYIIDTPTSFTRVVIYNPIGGANVSLWAAVQPWKEVQIINQ